MMTHTVVYVKHKEAQKKIRHILIFFFSDTRQVLMR